MPTTLTAAVLAAGLLLPSPLPDTMSSGSEPAPVVEVAGSTSATNGVLRRGCRRYSYSYEIATPYDDWTLELTIRDPRQRGVAAEALLGPSDPRADSRTFRLCRWATKAGRFTIHGKLTSYDGTHEEIVQLPTTTFRLRRPR
jgi:hypothetical protein